MLLAKLQTLDLPSLTGTLLIHLLLVHKAAITRQILRIASISLKVFKNVRTPCCSVAGVFCTFWKVKFPEEKGQSNRFLTKQ